MNVNCHWEEGGRNDQIYTGREGQKVWKSVLILKPFAHPQSSTFAICLYYLGYSDNFSGKKLIFPVLFSH